MILKNPQEIIDDVINQHKSRHQQTTEYEWGYEFTIHKDVFSPFIAPSGKLGFSFASLPIFKGKNILDVGCGSGIMACLISLNGAKKVVGIDINPSAITNANRNAKALGLNENVDFRHGSLLEPILPFEEFDIIYADLPFTNRKPKDILEAAFYDDNLKSLKNLITKVSKIEATKFSTIYIALSNLDGKELPELAKQNNLDWKPYITIDEGWAEFSIIKIQNNMVSKNEE